MASNTPMLLLSVMASMMGIGAFFTFFIFFFGVWRESRGEERQQAEFLLFIIDTELRTSANKQSFESEM